MRMGALAEQSRPVIESALRLQGALNAHSQTELRELVRAMNSYYSNRIEGQSTHPLNIEKALHKDFSKTPDIAKRQRIAIAHIEAERELEAMGLSEAQAFRSDTLRLAHQCLYSRLSVQDRTNEQGVVVEPGQWRTSGVGVSLHEPPIAHSVPLFLDRADATYARAHGLDAILVAAACAHHRLIWVHPFVDGNGRACRLQTHAILRGLTGGLWSVNGGLARRREDYYLRLSEADMARHGDLDGRGNLSEKMLVAWCEFFIAICRDQVEFMAKMLDLDALRARFSALIKIRAEERPGSGYRAEAILPLLHILTAGPVARADFVQMTGLGVSTARKTISQLVADGLLQSDSHRSELRIGFPLDSLNILFPKLYPEAEALLTEL